MTAYYERQLESARQFQDFVAIELHREGIIVNLLTSCRYQCLGESLAGIEIKNDRKMEITGNIYFETHEKTSPHIINWTESGILRKDNTWLWCIGNERTLYLIGKEQLRRIYEKYPEGNQYLTMVARKTDTSIGFTLSRVWVEKNLALKVIHCETNDK